MYVAYLSPSRWLAAIGSFSVFYRESHRDTDAKLNLGLSNDFAFFKKSWLSSQFPYLTAINQVSFSCPHLCKLETNISSVET